MSSVDNAGLAIVGIMYIGFSFAPLFRYIKEHKMRKALMVAASFCVFSCAISALLIIGLDPKSPAWLALCYVPAVVGVLAAIVFQILLLLYYVLPWIKSGRKRKIS